MKPSEVNSIKYIDFIESLVDGGVNCNGNISGYTEYKWTALYPNKGSQYMFDSNNNRVRDLTNFWKFHGEATQIDFRNVERMIENMERRIEKES